MPTTGPRDIAERGADRCMVSTPCQVRARHGAALGLGAQGSHDRALHINTIVSPIPTKVYKPATVIPRQTSAMTLSGWGVICLSGTALPLGYFPTRIDHAGGRELFRFQGTKAYRRRNGNFTKPRRARHRAPATERHLLELAAMFLSPTSASERLALEYRRNLNGGPLAMSALTADHLSCPRAVGMPCRLRSAAMSRKLVAPAACAFAYEIRT